MGFTNAYLSNAAVQLVIFENSNLTKVASYWFDSHFKWLQCIFDAWMQISERTSHFANMPFHCILCCLIAKIITSAFWALWHVKKNNVHLIHGALKTGGFKSPARRIHSCIQMRWWIPACMKLSGLWHSPVIKREGMMMIACCDWRLLRQETPVSREATLPVCPPPSTATKHPSAPQHTLNYCETAVLSEEGETI